MSELDPKVKAGEHDQEIDFDLIISSLTNDALHHEAKAKAARFPLTLFWHKRRARKKREDAALIQRIRDRYESKPA